jgi:endonuclease/exonuclease/phosphatase family metal-dependent hydrolase
MGEFSLLTLNTFGLPFFLGGWRLARQTDELRQLAPMVICLQEIQHSTHMPMLRRRLQENFPYLALEPGWWEPKGGLVMASRLPVADYRFAAYPNRGRPFGPGIGDWLTLKGVLTARLELDGQTVMVLNTHTQANYDADWRLEGQWSRVQWDQVDFLAQRVRAQPPEAMVIVCGDLNFPRHSPLYEALIAASGLIDPLSGDDRPTYRPFPLVTPASWAVPIDFILVRPPAGRAAPQVQVDIVPIENAAGRTGYQRFLTDHNALVLQARWE